MKKGGGMNVGSASILMVFVLLTLTTFSTLSLVSANADYKLSVKAAESAARYYAADAQAQAMLAQVDAVLAQTMQEEPERFADALSDLLGQEFAVQPNGSGAVVSYQVPLDERRALSVSLSAFPRAREGAHYRLTVWQVVQTQEWVGTDMIELWDGETGQLS